MSTAPGTPKGKAGKGIKSVFKDKRVLYGAAGVGAIGLVVLLKKGNAPATADGSGSSGQPISPANLDSSGTDNYNAISSIGQAWEDTWNQQFQGFSSQLGDISNQLGQINGPTATQPPTTGPAVKPAGGAGHGTGPGWGWYKVKAGDSYASIEKNATVSAANLFKFNTKAALNRLTPGEWVKTRSAAGPRPS